MNVRRRNERPRAAVSVTGSAAARQKHESELGNVLAGAGGMFDEENLEPGVRRVESRPN